MGYDTVAITCGLYAGSTRYYAAMLNAGNATIDYEAPLGRSWAANRTRIIGANGLQTLTIPIEKPARGIATPLRDVRISNHGAWEHVHWGAIYSAYGKAPFFEYYQDELHEIYQNRSNWLWEFQHALNQSVCDFFALEIDFSCKCDYTLDLRGKVGEKQADNLSINDTPYYQIWRDRHGFIANLSILDLVLNMGRESTLVLREMAKQDNNTKR